VSGRQVAARKTNVVQKLGNNARGRSPDGRSGFFRIRRGKKTKGDQLKVRGEKVGSRAESRFEVRAKWRKGGRGKKRNRREEGAIAGRFLAGVDPNQKNGGGGERPTEESAPAGPGKEDEKKDIERGVFPTGTNWGGYEGKRAENASVRDGRLKDEKCRELYKNRMPREMIGGGGGEKSFNDVSDDKENLKRAGGCAKTG